MNPLFRTQPGRLRTTMRLIAFAGLVTTAACASYYLPDQSWTSYREGEFGIGDLRREPCAIGGVVLRDGITLDLQTGTDFREEELTHAVQASLWSPPFDDAFTKAVGHEADVGWFSYLSLVPEDIRAQLLAAQARMGLPTPDVLSACREHLPNIRYLLLARVETTSLDRIVRTDVGSKHASGRSVRVTVDIYDIGAARSVWTHTADLFVGGPSNPSPEEVRAKRTSQPLDAAGGPVGVPGQVLAAPSLEEAVADCLVKILRILPDSDHRSMDDADT